ncbi:MAG: M56 family metallopeptidase [Cellulophaga sp.]
MDSLFSYLLRSAGIITIITVLFYLLLEKETFYKLNRFYLLIGILATTLLPFVIFKTYITIPVETNFILPDNSLNIPIRPPSFNLLNVIFYIYLTGVAFFFIRFLIHLGSLFLLLKKNKAKQIGSYKMMEIDTNDAPFSFFNYIVFNPKHYTKKELLLILTHEKVHSRQLHSIDIIFTQLFIITQWFNPFVWLYKKLVEQNLEFLADEATALNKSTKTRYQQLLLHIAIPVFQKSLTNNFYNSLLKKRILMLNKTTSKNKNLLKYLTIVPILALFLMSFNREIVLIPETSSIEKTTVDIPNSPIVLSNNKETVTDTIPSSNKNISIKKTVVANSMLSSIKGKKDPIYILNGKKITKKELEKVSTTSIKSINVLKGKEAVKLHGKNAKGGVVIITSKLKSSPKEKFNLNKDKALYIIDGKEAKSTSVNPDQIKDVNVLKGKAATDEYGDKGKNGVLVIRTKSTLKTPAKTNEIHSSDQEKPLYIVDGKEVISISIDPDKIKKMDVLKGKSATDKYGDKGKNGVIIITSKK